MRCIVYTRPDDGGVSILRFVAPQLPKEAPSAYYARMAQGVPADALDVHLVDLASIPTDQTFRAAWRNRGGQIFVDMDHARELHRDRLRQERGEELLRLDVEFMRALEQGDEVQKQEIIARKRALRDATHHPCILTAQTPEQLAGVTLAMATASVMPETAPAPPEPAPTPAQATIVGSGNGKRSWSVAELLARAGIEETTIPPPAPEPVKVEPPAPELPQAAEWSSDDNRRRHEALARVAAAVNEATANSVQQQMRYELALRARNQNMEAMELLQPEAAALGLDVQALVDTIIADRQRREQRMARANAIGADFAVRVNSHRGSDIDSFADVTVSKIKGDPDAVD
jgi:hypothetical protein